jgi:hypothetical protein
MQRYRQGYTWVNDGKSNRETRIFDRVHLQNSIHLSIFSGKQNPFFEQKKSTYTFVISI